jgi:hypothetical protein
MVKITEVNQIVDCITSFDSFHKGFEIVSVILSLGTNWWQLMSPYDTLDTENLSRAITFPLDLPEATDTRNQLDSSGVEWPGHPQTRGAFIAYDYLS